MSAPVLPDYIKVKTRLMAARLTAELLQELIASNSLSTVIDQRASIEVEITNTVNRAISQIIHGN